MNKDAKIVLPKPISAEYLMGRLEKISDIEQIGTPGKHIAKDGIQLFLLGVYEYQKILLWSKEIQNEKVLPQNESFSELFIELVDAKQCPLSHSSHKCSVHGNMKKRYVSDIRSLLSTYLAPIGSKV